MPKNTKQGEERRGMVKKTCVSVKELCNRFSQKKKKKKSSFTGQERRKSEGEGEKRPKNRERGAQSERGKSAFEI